MTPPRRLLRQSLEDVCFERKTDDQRAEELIKQLATPNSETHDLKSNHKLIYEKVRATFRRNVRLSFPKCEERNSSRQSNQEKGDQPRSMSSLSKYVLRYIPETVRKQSLGRKLEELKIL